jgi:hypothetical protein
VNAGRHKWAKLAEAVLKWSLKWEHYSTWYLIKWIQGFQLWTKLEEIKETEPADTDYQGNLKLKKMWNFIMALIFQGLSRLID